MAAYDDLIAALQPTAEQFEGRVPWMYLDGRGYLTIGIGHLLHRSSGSVAAWKQAIGDLWKFGGGPQDLRQSTTNALDFLQSCRAATLPKHPTTALKSAHAGMQTFIHTIDAHTGALASTNNNVVGVLGIDLPDPALPAADAMFEESKLLMKLPHGQRNASKFFACYNSFRLTDDGIDALFAADVRETARLVAAKFKGFKDFPVPAQAGLVDLAFQMGATGMANHLKGLFKKAVEDQSWANVAKLCPMIAQDDRNQWRKDQFTAAAAAAKPPKAAAAASAPAPRKPSAVH